MWKTGGCKSRLRNQRSGEVVGRRTRGVYSQLDLSQNVPKAVKTINAGRDGGVDEGHTVQIIY